MIESIKAKIRTIPHYPKHGIMFRDITSLLKDAAGLRETIDDFAQRYRGQKIDKVAGIEARGFILGTPVAYLLGVGFVPIRKKGKLPGATIGYDYELEYGIDRIEVHTDAIERGERVLLIDDLLATGGTAEAAIRLIEMSGGTVVAAAFIVDLPEIGGRARLEKQGYRVFAQCAFEGH